MTTANDFMHGGDHYRRGGKAQYQHWDFAIQVLENRYLEGAWTKHVSRHRFKGVAKLDLEKAQHYVLKTREALREGLIQPLGIVTSRHPNIMLRELTERFIQENELNYYEAAVMRRTVDWTSDADLLLIAEDIRLLQVAL